jgi:hypothetical protein
MTSINYSDLARKLLFRSVIVEKYQGPWYFDCNDDSKTIGTLGRCFCSTNEMKAANIPDSKSQSYYTICDELKTSMKNIIISELGVPSDTQIDFKVTLSDSGSRRDCHTYTIRIVNIDIRSIATLNNKHNFNIQISTNKLDEKSISPLDTEKLQKLIIKNLTVVAILVGATDTNLDDLAKKYIQYIKNCISNVYTKFVLMSESEMSNLIDNYTLNYIRLNYPECLADNDKFQ